MPGKATAIILILLAAIACTPKNDKAGDRPTYKIGYMICNSEKETLERFIPFSKYMGDKLGVNFEIIAIDTINFSREIDKLDFVHINSLLYIMLNRFNGVEVLAAEFSSRPAWIRNRIWPSTRFLRAHSSTRR
ncbi:MAG: phosphate/phosphite/phosphonate ABC transporter substrate-binding protein [Desulfobulbaceae bacterium]|nr:phosphate/phosphite/phosphonate ABC transporter substrate-binding protein [Desulfobulbaceae bacterium]